MAYVIACLPCPQPFLLIFGRLRLPCKQASNLHCRYWRSCCHPLRLARFTCFRLLLLTHYKKVLLLAPPVLLSPLMTLCKKRTRPQLALAPFSSRFRALLFPAMPLPSKVQDTLARSLNNLTVVSDTALEKLAQTVPTRQADKLQLLLNKLLERRAGGFLVPGSFVLGGQLGS